MVEPKKPMREAMPLVTAFIDDMRSAFGREEIDTAIRNGLAGLPHFWAREGDNEVGTHADVRGTAISAAQMNLVTPAKKESRHG